MRTGILRVSVRHAVLALVNHLLRSLELTVQFQAVCVLVFCQVSQLKSVVTTVALIHQVSDVLSLSVDINNRNRIIPGICSIENSFGWVGYYPCWICAGGQISV